ncbi:spermidine/putrescine ABC transporter substrate-binding protein [Candidatus Villigracilis saccharophilus]|uniref:ABC transporter substrate-binding protein n=1 Tax=Candidatus Villigracilis saccharophilus TaxID=3140684 RepID=UPI0031357A2A|nr:spermidine/putrescine ABC transporter substrate-binding protein [Anaerolineales bacterium]
MTFGKKYNMRLFLHCQLILSRIFLSLLTMTFVTACISPTPPPALTPTAHPLAQEIIFYSWAEDVRQSVPDMFTEEYGVKVKYIGYESQEEAIANIKAGQIYDVVLIESRFIPQLIKENLLAELDQRNLSNSKNLSANFRDLAYDPGNRYSIPNSWGTTGLVVRSDLVVEPVTLWADLWDPRYAGKVGLWMDEPREVISLTLKSLGYSANSEDPAELEETLTRLLELKPNIIALEDANFPTPDGMLANGQVVISMGYAGNAYEAAENNLAVNYILPQDGALLWNDTLVIPANSPNRFTAELFLNFLMRAEINATVVNENIFPTPNEAAYEFIDPEILNNPLIYPPNEDLVNAELILPLSPEGQRLYDEIWEQFSTAP